MNRREFVRTSSLAAAGAIAFPALPTMARNFKTKHLIWIINGNGSRKSDWHENEALSPNYARLARAGFVYTESQNDTVANHWVAWSELLTGERTVDSALKAPTPFQYLRRAYHDESTKYWFVRGVSQYRRWSSPTLTDSVTLTADSLRTNTAGFGREVGDFVHELAKMNLDDFGLMHSPIPRQPFIGDALSYELIPHILRQFKPRLLILHQVGHDVGHYENGVLDYERVCRTTDEQIGRIFDFVRGDPYFSATTAIIVRPEFGRDDEISNAGELHHSEGYPATMRSTEIWYGPDFKAGVSNKVVNRRDVVPTITRLFNVDSTYASGQVRREMFYNGVFD